MWLDEPQDIRKYTNQSKVRLEGHTVEFLIDSDALIKIIDKDFFLKYFCKEDTKKIMFLKCVLTLKPKVENVQPSIL